jgi:hypothetical protein
MVSLYLRSFLVVLGVEETVSVPTGTVLARPYVEFLVLLQADKHIANSTKLNMPFIVK